MRIIQISDVHLFSTVTELSTIHLQNFTNVVHYIMENKNTLNADLIIVTGDISHDGGLLSYDIFFSLMLKIKLPFYFLPGNHDNRLNLYTAGIKYGMSPDINMFSDDGWMILSVDSVIDNQEHGIVSGNALKELEHAVSSSGGRRVALFLHHHLIPVGTPTVDDCMLRNASDLLELCCKFNVKFIGSGHAHTIFQKKINDILLSVSPAVCSQWKNGTKDVNVVKSSGFSIVSLSENVHVESWFI